MPGRPPSQAIAARHKLPRPSPKALHAFDPPGGRVASARFVRWQAGNFTRPGVSDCLIPSHWLSPFRIPAFRIPAFRPVPALATVAVQNTVCEGDTRELDNTI